MSANDARKQSLYFPEEMLSEIQIQAQRLDRDLADIPVVLLSADMRVKEMQDELGAIDYLKKPVDIDELLETVRRNCGGVLFYWVSGRELGP